MSERLRAEIEQGRKAIADRIVDAQRQALQQARDAALEDAARAAGAARLPEGYQWGEEATEHFNFGKARAAAAIRALKGRQE